MHRKVVLPKTFFLFSRNIFGSTKPCRLFLKKDKTSTDRLSPSKSLKPLMQDYALNAWEGNYLGLVVNQVQGNVGLVNMQDLKNLDLAVTQALDNMSLMSMSNPKNLDLTVSKVQDNMGLENMSDPRNMDLTISQV